MLTAEQAERVAAMQAQRAEQRLLRLQAECARQFVQAKLNSPLRVVVWQVFGPAGW